MSTTIAPKSSRSLEVNVFNGVQLIQEQLSRARMRRPQKSASEAIRPAREIVLSSQRRERDRLMGL